MRTARVLALRCDAAPGRPPLNADESAPFDFIDIAINPTLGRHEAELGCEADAPASAPNVGAREPAPDPGSAEDLISPDFIAADGSPGAIDLDRPLRPEQHAAAHRQMRDRFRRRLR